MLHAVSHHAIIRYVERVLGLPVDEWLAGTEKMREADRAALVCERAGLPVDAVRELVLCRPVLVAVLANFRQVIVRYEGFAYVVRSGVVATILTERMRDERIGCHGKLQERDRTQMRKDMIRTTRRLKGKNKNKDRRRLAEVD